MTTKPMGPAPLRRSARVQVRIPVMVSGTLPDGKHFHEEAYVLTVSKYGAKLKMPLPLKVGGELRVQPRTRNTTGQFRVVWVGREGTPRAGEVGIEYLKVSNLLGVTFPE